MSYNRDQDPVGGGFRDYLGVRGSGPTCGAGDLRGMLQRIADHITQADERQQAALHDVQYRLARFAEDAHSARATMPPDLAATFARIEDGITRLTGRFATEDGATPGGQGNDVFAESRRPAAYGAPSHYDQRLEFHGFGGPEFAGQNFGGAAAPQAGGDDDHWDRASAEALARIYEPASSARQPVFDPAVATRSEHPPVTNDIRGRPRQSSAVAPEQPATDRLEKRFAEIAARIEQTLAEVRPESSLLALEARFDSFAQRMDSAFSDLATRADVQKLADIEANVRDLAQQLDRSRNSFGRLESVEAHLRLLIEQISDHRFSRLLEQHALSDSHIARLAEAVVQRLDERQFQPEDPRQSMDRLAELRDLIEQFVTSQRQGQETTVGALATVQQAVLNMLERMEALEQARPLVTASGEQDARTGYQDRENFGLNPGRSIAGASSTNYPIAAEAQERAAGAAAELPAHSTSVGNQFSEPAGPERVAESITQLSREDFLAAARRAARKASSQAADELEEPARATVRARTASGGSRRAAGPRPVTGLVVATLAVVLAVGIGLTTYSIYKETAKERGSAIERSLPALERSGLAPDGAGIQGTPVDDADASEAPASKEATGPADTAPQGTPEFVIDDLPVTPAPPVRDEEVPGRRAVTQLPVGVVLDSGTMATSEDVARIQQQHALAQLSTSLGAAQAGTTMPLPAALIPQSQEATPSSAQPPAQSGGANRVLPPATIGPLSLRLAAANGDPAAEFEVAARFAEGKGVKQDLKEAVTWFQRSAARGYAPAQYRLGTLYERGVGVKADRGRAMAWYRSAAEKGDLKAMHNLAVLNASGNPANYRTAAFWFAEAAARGLGDSQYNLAVLYETGRGVERDLKQAFKWFALAARSGDKEATRRRDRVKLMLDPRQLAIAEGLVSSWKPAGTEPQQSRSRQGNSGPSA